MLNFNHLKFENFKIARSKFCVIVTGNIQKKLGRKGIKTVGSHVKENFNLFKKKSNLKFQNSYMQVL